MVFNIFDKGKDKEERQLNLF